MEERTRQVKAALFAAPRQISLERAKLYTASWQNTEGEPVILRRAKATAHILDHVALAIRPGELLAGNRTVLPRSGIISPEMDPYWIYEELDTLATRPQDSFFISEEDKDYYRQELFPYWKGRSLKDRINAKLPAAVRDAQQRDIIKLNQTDKGQGHIIMEYQTFLTHGLQYKLNQVAAQAETRPDNRFYAAAACVLAASQRFILRYAQLADTLCKTESDPKRRQELSEIARISCKVATDKPATLHEACQLFWYINLIAQYESNASSISPGRFDQYMYPFYLHDRASGVPLEETKELLRHLWLKMNDVVLLRSADSAKYFAGFPTGYTIILGGLDAKGRCAVNELSYLILDTYQDIRLPQPNLGVRVNELTPRSFLAKTAETIRLGTGIPQLFNDEVIVPGFLHRGVALEDARDYAVVGCVELSIPGKTYGLHDIALFNLLKVMEVTLQQAAGRFSGFDELITAIKEQIDHYVIQMTDGANLVELGHRDHAPTPFLSCFIDQCLEKGLDVSAGGACYNFSGVQGIGTANLSDSLYAIRQVCFVEKKLSLPALVKLLQDDFAGETGKIWQLRLINQYAKYGNDLDEVDDIGADLLSYYCHRVTRYHNLRGGLFLPGSYTVSAHIPLGAAVGATADGRRAGEQLADGGLSPMVGRDQQGPTAVLKSVSKLDNYLTSNGSLLNVKFHPTALAGRDGLNKMISYIEAFMKLKLQHIQFNCIAADTLREAQKNPQDHKNLVIRVAGYSAIFIELNKAIQDDIIARTEHSL